MSNPCLSCRYETRWTGDDPCNKCAIVTGLGSSYWEAKPAAIKPAPPRTKGSGTKPEAKTLRDEFAMVALMALLNPEYGADSLAAPAHAYRLADAMMEARKQ